MNKLEKILEVTFPLEIKITSATNSTNKVKKDSIFFGLRGEKNHGSEYIELALELGASIAVHNDSSYISERGNVFYIEDLEDADDFFVRDKIYYFLEEFHQIPNIQNRNNFFAFTGTNGKTSTAYLCHQLLISQDCESVYIGTIGTQHNSEEINQSFSSKTTPDIFELFNIFKFYDFQDSVSVCIEMSSHALNQDRLKYLSCLNSASILNIGTDHLDYHLNLNNYANAKFSIFDTTSQVRLINENLKTLGDDYDFIKNSPYKLTCIGSENQFSDIYYEIIESNFNKSIFQITINNPPFGYPEDSKKTYKFSSSLFPDFNIQNLVFAICSIGFANFSTTNENNLSFLSLPQGRTELISDISANVIIDFAHNAEGFELILSSIKSYFDNLIIIFGCGGDRDKLKRPQMLKIAMQNGKKVIFTSDNSRSESFNSIYSDAIESMKNHDVLAIEDRKEAIIQGSKMIGDNDCLVILGKGHENTQEINGNFLYFSDHEVVNEIYK